MTLLLFEVSVPGLVNVHSALDFAAALPMHADSPSSLETGAAASSVQSLGFEEVCSF